MTITPFVCRIAQLIARERTPEPLENIVGSMNATLRGWSNYFHYCNSSMVLHKVRGIYRRAPAHTPDETTQGQGA